MVSCTRASHFSAIRARSSAASTFSSAAFSKASARLWIAAVRASPSAPATAAPSARRRRPALAAAPAPAASRTVECRTAPVQLSGAVQPLQQGAVQAGPHARPLPITQPSPARHARAAPHLLRQVLPWQTGAQHEQDAGQRHPVRDRGRPPFGRGWAGGTSGEITTQRSSGTRNFAMLYQCANRRFR